MIICSLEPLDIEKISCIYVTIIDFTSNSRKKKEYLTRLKTLPHNTLETRSKKEKKKKMREGKKQRQVWGVREFAIGVLIIYLQMHDKFLLMSHGYLIGSLKWIAFLARIYKSWLL
jgi:hypothetical protein